LLSSTNVFSQRAMVHPKGTVCQNNSTADYDLTIAVKPIELAPNRIISATTYNGQFPGPLLRFAEGQQVTIDVHNQTDTPEQLHWHGSLFPRMSMARPKKALPSSPPMGAAAFRLFPGLPGIASTTLMCTLGWI